MLKPYSFYETFFNPAAPTAVNNLAARLTTATFLDNLNAVLTESGSTTGKFATNQAKQQLHAPGVLHAADTSPLRIYAAGGDISGLTLFSGKASSILASRDISDIAFYIQNVRSSDLTVVSAGRDIIAYNANSPLRTAAVATGNLPSSTERPKAGDIQINGPGTLQVLAGAKLPIPKTILGKFPADVDLVEIAPTADPPVCRLMDYGKFKYQEQKKAAEAKAKQKIIEIKEVKFRPGTDEGDYAIKMRNLRRFIAEDGDKGKVTLRYRGREITHQDIGMRMLERIRDELAAFEAELALWESIKSAPELKPFENYLRQYPSGKFAELAQFRLDTLLEQAGEKRVQLAPSAGNPNTAGTANTSTRVATKLSLSDQCHGKAFQSRKTMKSGRSDW